VSSQLALLLARAQKNIVEDPQAPRKQFQQVHLSIHNSEEAYINAIEKGRKGSPLSL
jgi:hypothetical protein